MEYRPRRRRARGTVGVKEVSAVRTAYRLDRRRVREAFDRAAPDYDGAATVIREIGRRLVEHLDPIRVDPERILDVGVGTGVDTAEVARRFRGARAYGIDISLPMLSSARRRRSGRWFSRPRYVCGDAQNLPIASGGVQLVFSNATLEWCDDPDAVFREIARVLTPGGLLMLSTFGPDTLRELRRTWAEVDDWVHVHRFIDMHDLGDALVRADFTGVVMETERLTVQYTNLDALFADLRRCGCVNAARGRNPGLTGPRRLRAVRDAYGSLRRHGQLPVSCEVIYAHAWRGPLPQAEVSLKTSRRRQVKFPQ